MYIIIKQSKTEREREKEKKEMIKFFLNKKLVIKKIA
jgi:hypothetical protein